MNSPQAPHHHPHTPQWPHQPGAPRPFAPIPPPQRSRSAVVIVVAVLGVFALLGVGIPVALVLFARASIPGATELEPEEVPKLLRKHMPCKRSCQVTQVFLYDGFFSVSVLSEDIEGRTLTYRVYPATGAELALSQDGLHESSHVTIDLDEVDWSHASKLVDHLEDKAVSNRSVSYVQLSKCEYDKEETELVRACFKANILTERGDLERKVDAKTGKRRE